ncbi:hypothetical protein CN650_002392 [Escherichia coli]|nr:hypothetical protein [Escherichia coli]
MLQIVGALILLIAGFAILRLLFRALISTASALAGLILLCLFGPALLAGYITERITRLFHIRWLAGVFLTIAGMIISFMWGLDGKHIALEAHTFDSVKFILTTALAGGLLAVPLQIKNIQQNGITPEDISKEINGYHNAAAVVLAHNHPSGEVTPSKADRLITERLVQALALVDIRVPDHLIVGGNQVFSFAEHGLL